MTVARVLRDSPLGGRFRFQRIMQLVEHLVGNSNQSRKVGRRKLRLAVLCAVAAVAAVVSTGCDPDDYNLGQDSRSRSDRANPPTGPKYYANRVGQPIRADSPEFLAPTESSLDKAPRVADPDALVLQDDPLLQKIPEGGVETDKEDHVAGNFKYYKEGYREPLLPTATDNKDSQPIGADGLGMSDRQANSLKPSDSDIAGPSGVLGELQSQHKSREKYNLKHAIKLDPYEPHDYSRGMSDSELDETSENIIRSDDATSSPPASPAQPSPPAPHRP